MRNLLIISLMVMSCTCGRLPSGPDPLEFPVEGEENKDISRRSFGNNYPWFIPAVYTVPQVIEVHHVVYLQQPDARCFPRPIPGRPTTAPDTTNDSSTTAEGLMGRFGETNTTAAEQPSKCVWAIVACCSPGSKNIRYTCFELLGCQGAFWDVNPCEGSVVMAAANTALKFYMASPSSNDVSSNLNE